MSYKRIRTEADLKKYIKRKLGQGILNVELTEEQLTDCINDAIKKFTQNAYEGYTEDIIILPIYPDTKKYILDSKIIALFDCRVGSSSYFSFPDKQVLSSDMIFRIFSSSGSSILDTSQIFTVYSKIQQIEHFFRKIPNYSFNSLTNELFIMENIRNLNSDKLLLHVAYEYIPSEEDDIYDHVWVKEYALALANYQLGVNLGKYEQSLVGGSKINYERMLNDSKERIQQLEEKLLSDYGPPLGIECF